MLKNKLVEVEFILGVEKKKSFEAATKANGLRRQLSCPHEHNKKLIEESCKNEAELQDCKVNLKELEKSLDLEKVMITHMLCCCCYLGLVSYVFVLCSSCQLTCRS